MDVIDRLFETEDQGEADRLVEELKALEYDDVQHALRAKRANLADAPPYSASHLAYLYTLFRIPIGAENFQKIIEAGDKHIAGIFSRYARHEFHRADGKKAVPALEERLKATLRERDADDLQEELVESLFALGGEEAQERMQGYLPSLSMGARNIVYAILTRLSSDIYEQELWWAALERSYKLHPEDNNALSAMRIMDPGKTERSYPAPRHVEKPREEGWNPPPFFS